MIAQAESPEPEGREQTNSTNTRKGRMREAQQELGCGLCSLLTAIGARSCLVRMARSKIIATSQPASIRSIKRRLTMMMENGKLYKLPQSNNLPTKKHKPGTEGWNLVPFLLVRLMRAENENE